SLLCSLTRHGNPTPTCRISRLLSLRTSVHLKRTATTSLYVPITTLNRSSPNSPQLSARCRETSRHMIYCHKSMCLSLTIRAYTSTLRLCADPSSSSYRIGTNTRPLAERTSRKTTFLGSSVGRLHVLKRRLRS